MIEYFPAMRRLKSTARFFAILLMALSLSTLAAYAGSDRFIDSDDYKSKDFKAGILGDYKDLVKGDNLEWAWVEKGTTLADYKVVIETFADGTDDLGKSQLGTFKTIFKDYMEKLKGSKGTLTAEMSVYEVQKYSPGKAWIPFAGGHQMQAGMGVEMILKDKGGKTVAKFRHFAREGIAIESAAQEVAEDLKKYIAKH